MFRSREKKWREWRRVNTWGSWKKKWKDSQCKVIVPLFLFTRSALLSYLLRVGPFIIQVSEQNIIEIIIYHQTNHPPCTHTHIHPLGHILMTSLWGFPGGSDGKESASNARDSGSILGLGRSPEEGNGYPLRYSCLENPMGRGAWQATVLGIAKSQDWMTDTSVHFWWLKCLRICPPAQETQVWSLRLKNPLEKEMATLSSIVAWPKSLGGYWPWTGKRVGHDWATKQQNFIF